MTGQSILTCHILSRGTLQTSPIPVQGSQHSSRGFGLLLKLETLNPSSMPRSCLLSIGWYLRRRYRWKRKHMTSLQSSAVWRIPATPRLRSSISCLSYLHPRPGTVLPKSRAACRKPPRSKVILPDHIPGVQPMKV